MLMVDDEVTLLQGVMLEVEDTYDTPLLILCDDLDVLVYRRTLVSVGVEKKEKEKKGRREKERRRRERKDGGGRLG